VCVWRILVASLLPAFVAQAAPVVCATCHPKETAQYLKSGMGQSLSAQPQLADGTVRHTRSGSTIAVKSQNRQMVHELTERGLTATYPVAYQIGANRLGSSYIVKTGDYFFESPASWFRAYGWDVSPGFGDAAVLDFDAPINETCLFCHAGSARFAGNDGRRYIGPELTAISCERCHGPTAEHVRHPSSGNVLNPSKLPQRARDSVCEQCHLEGQERLLNPGKNWWDYQPGQNLEDTIAVYVMRQGEKETRVVGHVDQLAQSQCARQSAGKLWCGTCHNPHRETVNHQAEIRAICTACHATLSKAAHPEAVVECTSCHMPKRSNTDISHVAITDHRILRHPQAVDAVTAIGDAALSAWVEPPSAFRDRDLGLAEVNVGFREKSRLIGQAGLRLLLAMPDSERRKDAVVLSTLGGLLLQQDKAEASLGLFQLAAAREPDSAQHALYLAMALMGTGDSSKAEAELKHAIELDPSFTQSYIELCTLYRSQGRKAEVQETLNRYLRWNPQSIAFRILKQSTDKKQ
jgi:tetratricopeptide (TPR) repeat protein